MVHLQRQTWKESNKHPQWNVLTTTLPACLGEGFAPYAAACPATEWNAFPSECAAHVLCSINQQQTLQVNSEHCPEPPTSFMFSAAWFKNTLRCNIYYTLFSAGPRWQIKICAIIQNNVWAKITSPWRERRQKETSVCLTKQAEKLGPHSNNNCSIIICQPQVKYDPLLKPSIKNSP